MRFFLRIYKFWLFSFKRMSPGLVLPSTTAGKDGGGRGAEAGKKSRIRKPESEWGSKFCIKDPPKKGHTRPRTQIFLCGFTLFKE